MAKSPKRDSGRRKPRTIPSAKPKPPADESTKPAAAQPVKPSGSKPVKPAAAQPVKPPAAKPVKPAAAQPVKPPAAKPVKPAAAQPVKPPAAKPVKPAAAQPVKPPAAKPVKPAAARPVKPPAAKPVKPAAAQPVKPPAAKPVKPAAAQPVKPPAAKPVKPAAAQPVKPPAAKPVKPAATQPLKPPSAKSVRPAAAQPVKPATAQPAKPAAAGRRGGRASEEVVGARGRAAPAARGMSVAAKAGLLTALVTLLVTALTVYLSSGGIGGSNTDSELNRYGYMAASALGGGDSKWWQGTKTSSVKHDSVWVKKKLGDVWGEKGTEFWDTQFKKISTPPDRELSTPKEIADLQAAKRRYDEEIEKLDKAGGGGGSAKGTVKSGLATVYKRIPREDESGRFKVLAAWIRGPISVNKEGEFLAGTSPANSIHYDFAKYRAAGGGRGHVDGSLDSGGKSYDVRIFTANVGGGGGRIGGHLTGYVAVWQKPGGTTSGIGMGMLMLVLAPLLTGLTAFSIANNHTKNVRGLSREIDRLGTSGDPNRHLRTQGKEASMLARSVERMVGNIEFRSDHEGQDLDEIVSRERKVAEEIHGALTSKNPPRLDNYEVETLFKPGFEIGGDHFEYFRIDDDHLGIILLDTNVRGVTAALVMSATKAYVRTQAPGVLSPAEVLRRVNNELAGELPSGRHVTALYVVLNMSEGSATIASAGHLPLLVYRHNTGKVAKVNPEGLALGLDTGPVFDRALQEGDIPIGVGDRIVLYTDGALKVQDAQGDEFGEQRFYQSVLREAPKNSQAFVNFVGSGIDQFHVDVQQNDDITISTVKRLR